MSRRVVVCDFDGTLVRVNSFPLWVLSIAKGFLLEFRPFLSVKVVFLLVVRKLGLVSHFDFKKNLVNLSRFLNNDYVSSSLSRHVNDRVLDFLNSCEGTRVISSAAPLVYLEHTVDLIGAHVSHVIGSTFVGDDFFENYSENKVESLKQVCQDPKDVVVITDHYEDLPLMKIASKVYLVSPSEKTLRVVESAGIQYDILC